MSMTLIMINNIICRKNQYNTTMNVTVIWMHSLVNDNYILLYNYTRECDTLQSIKYTWFPMKLDDNISENKIYCEKRIVLVLK